jgi:hypothetical protein
LKSSWAAIITLTAAIALLSAPAVCSASDASGVMATIDGAVAAFNRGDMKAWTAACASSASIIDDFPPHAWSGPTACADWWNAFVGANKKNDMSWGTLLLGTGWHVAVTANRGYTVFPATYTYRVKGRPAKDSGIFTLVLIRAPRGWRIVAWSWAQH